MAGITINGITLDPDTHGSALASLGFASPDVSDTDYVLVQFTGPPTSAQRAELVQAGVEILEYVPENTFLCRFPGTNLAQIRALPFVALATRYLKGFKINPGLVAGDNLDPAAILAMAGGSNLLRSHQEKVTVVLQKGAATEDSLREVAAAAGVDPGTLEVHGNRVTVSVTSDRLQSLANVDAVRHVEPRPRNGLFNDVAASIINVAPLQAGAIGGIDALDGAGQVVAVCDTGFDRGSRTDVHPAFQGRVKRLIPLGRAKANDPDGHGTHVCGSVLGADEVDGYGPIKGMAPAARLVMQSVLDPDGGLGGLPIDLNTLFAPPYQADGARVHSNSWGDSRASSHRQYDSQAQDVDEFVHAHRDIVICFAAGNDGIDSNRNGVIDDGSVSPPGTAKNCITVGASESEREGSRTYGSFRPQFYPTNPLKDDFSASNREGLAAFSSRGTTVDNRIKPDVVAPGTSILSCLSRDAALSTVFGDDPPAGYMYDTGTSMATPIVAGCAALVRQHLIRDRGLEAPSAALVKAMLINGATPLKGQYVPSEAGAPPNSDQGFGRVDLQATIAASVALQDEAAPLTDTGDQIAFQAEAGPDGRLKVTLVWTDPPGLGLQNDLDLVVSADGRTAHGNRGVGAPDFDRTNNVEQVSLSGLPPGTAATIEVRAFRIALFPQSFALVIRAE